MDAARRDLLGQVHRVGDHHDGLCPLAPCRRDGRFELTGRIGHHPQSHQVERCASTLGGLPERTMRRVAFVHQHGDTLRRRHGQVQQFDQLAEHDFVLRRDAGDVAAGPRQAGHEAVAHRVRHIGHDDRHRGGGLLQRARCLRGSDHDDLHALCKQLAGQRVQASDLAVGKEEPVRHVASLHPAEVAHARLEGVVEGRAGGLRGDRQAAHPPRGRQRLRLQRRRGDGGSTCQQGESAPLHSMTLSARSSSDGGMVKSSTLAVFRLMTRLKRVGCSIGRSAA